MLTKDSSYTSTKWWRSS